MQGSSRQGGGIHENICLCYFIRGLGIGDQSCPSWRTTECHRICMQGTPMNWEQRYTVSGRGDTQNEGAPGSGGVWRHSV